MKVLLDLLMFRGGLLGQTSRWEGLGEGVRSKELDYSAVDIAIGLGGCLALVVIAWFLLSWFTDVGGRRQNSPRKLFRELCAVHGLDRGGRRLLMNVAQWQRLAHPARLFLEPERLDPVNLSGPLRGQPQVATLRARLFCDLEPVEPVSEQPVEAEL